MTEIEAKPSSSERFIELIPGLLLCGGVTAAALLFQTIETRLFGRAWLDALVLAILLGALIRSLHPLGPRFVAGIAFGAKTVLEIAVMLLGATLSAGAILGAGGVLLAAIVVVVVLGIAASYTLGRLFRLPHRMATLIACGNSICGNSAIAAVAPVIGADAEDVAASIAFTAILGVAVVLGLPLLAVAWHMTAQGFGVFAGLTVYAVPQVLAATAPVSSISAQTGTLVKLVRVLMLGPVVLALSLIGRRDAASDRPRLALGQLVPWFIVGFLALAAARSSDLIPAACVAPAGALAGGLTIVSMAALGLGVDVRVVARAGLRVTTVVTFSLVALGGLAMLAIVGLRLG